MVSSNLIDVEVMFRNHTNIKKKIMIDSKNNNMSVLKSKILEVCEIFPKLYGLYHLLPINLKKKTENGEIDLIEEANFLKSKDIILFDLSFHEVWLDIQMTLVCDELIKKIQFELRVILGKNESDFEDILINLGIKSFATISIKNDYYVFNQLDIDYSNKKGDNNNVVNFNFDEELKCTLRFVNLSEMIYNKIKQNNNFFSHSFNYKIAQKNENEIKKELKQYFNKYFEDYLEKKKERDISEYHRILWKYTIDETIYDERNSSSNDSRNSISIFNLDNKKDIFSLNRNGSSSLNSNFQFQRNSTSNFLSLGGDENENYFENNYKREISYMKNIDFISLIKKNSQNYISFSAFNKKIPDTRNYVELNHHKEETFEIQIPNNNINYINISTHELEERFGLSIKIKIISIFLIILVLFIIIKKKN